MSNVLKREELEADLVAANPILKLNEICYVIDKGYLKLGTGTTAFKNLPVGGIIGDMIPAVGNGIYVKEKPLIAVDIPVTCLGGFPASDTSVISLGVEPSAWSYNPIGQITSEPNGLFVKGIDRTGVFLQNYAVTYSLTITLGAISGDVMTIRLESMMDIHQGTKIVDLTKVTVGVPFTVNIPIGRVPVGHADVEMILPSEVEIECNPSVVISSMACLMFADINEKSRTTASNAVFSEYASVAGYAEQLNTTASPILHNGDLGIGYAIGAGGTVTQTTSRTANVSLNKSTGKITLHSITATANQVTKFKFINSCINIEDVVVVSVCTATGTYLCNVTGTYNGGCYISVFTPIAVTTAEAPTINFAVIKGAYS
jgi:hypothetical protein